MFKKLIIAIFNIFSLISGIQIELHISRFPAGRGKCKCGKFPAGNSLRENAGMREKIISQNWRFLTEFAAKSLKKLLKFHF